MMTFLCALAATSRLAPVEAWYGPVTATFPVQFAGNPYDYTENDVSVQFRDAKGHTESRLAYYNEKYGFWSAVLVAPRKGTYHAQLFRNGVPIPTPNKEGALKVSRALDHGYCHPDPSHPNRFVWDDGSKEIPVGFDLGWQDNSILPITGQIAKMGTSGVDWTRIWACSWDGKNPWWPSDKTKLAPETLWPPALDKWSDIFSAAEAAHVGVQFVLFHHGEFSSQVDPNWPDNPWSVKNGGFLQKPGDFFTDAEAKKRAKIWLRYAVARYGASPSIFGWELFNEVQWVDPIHIDHRWTEVDAWHHEMADYIRSIDPYHHPVTSSSEQEPGFDSSLDYLQPHTYPINISASILSTVMPTSKPGFYGEFGPSDMKNADLRTALRDGIWAGLIANHAGSGMFWYWDSVEKQNLYSEFALARKGVDFSNWWIHPDAKPISPRVVTADRSTFTFQPGGGWQPSTQTTYSLPEGATPDSLSKLSGYVQGNAHRDMMAGPIVLKVDVPKTSKVTITLGEISKGGGALKVSVDDSVVHSENLSASDALKPVVFEVPSGAHQISLLNDGPDWFTLSSVRIENVASAASVEALADRNWMLARMTRQDEKGVPVQIKMGGLPLSDGAYVIKWLDLKTGGLSSSKCVVHDSSTQLEANPKDAIAVFERS